MTQPARPGTTAGTTTGTTTGTAAVVAAALVGGWAVGVTAVLQGLGWLGEQVLLYYTGDRPGWAWPAVSLVNAALVAAPAALLARVPRSATVRVVGRAWLAGATAVGLLGTVRAVPGAEPELHLALLALGAGTLALAWRDRGTGASQGGRDPGMGAARGAVGAGPVPFAAAGGLLVLLPWLWAGALGGRLETLLALVAAATVGWLAGTVLDRRFWVPFQTLGQPPFQTLGQAPVQTLGQAPVHALGQPPRQAPVRGGRLRLVLVGGLAAGVTLLLLAAGVGASGAQLPLLLILPVLGFAAAGLTGLAGSAPAGTAGPNGTPSPLGRGGLPVGVLVGLAVLGPLALVDPEEVSLLLAVTRDVPFWAGMATAGALVAAALVGIAYPLGLARPRSRWVGAAVAAALVVAAGGLYAGPGQPGFHGDRLFVVLADQADLSGLPSGTGQAGRDARAGEVYRRLVAHAEDSQAGIRAELDRLGVPYTAYYLVNAVEVDGGPAVRAWLSRRGEVDRVLRSQRLRPLPAAGRPLGATAGLAPDHPEWNIGMIRANRVWDELGVTGAGVVVGTADSGVDAEHPALAAGFRGGGDSWLDPWNGTGVPTDRNGHGTHTLGSAVGRGGIGVAPGARWTGCANLDRGLGNPARYVDCLQFMLAPYPSGGDPWRDGDPRRAPHVLTNSWGCPPIEGCDGEVLRPATAALVAAGLYLVVSAGNTGPFCGSINDPPATYPDVLTVGAVDRDGEVTGFSSRGQVGPEQSGPASHAAGNTAGSAAGSGKPDLVAPGERVVSAVPGGGYRALDGTSMATPQVAGVVALMWSANPAMVGDVATTTSILRETAQPVTVDEPACGGPPALAGAGLVDAHAAVLAARTASG